MVHSQQLIQIPHHIRESDLHWSPTITEGRSGGITQTVPIPTIIIVSQISSSTAYEQLCKSLHGILLYHVKIGLKVLLKKQLSCEKTNFLSSLLSGIVSFYSIFYDVCNNFIQTIVMKCSNIYSMNNMTQHLRGIRRDTI